MPEEEAIIIVKKAKGGHGGGHGGAWKVAYADFVTAMMAFFLVMWILGLSQDSRKSISAYFNDPAGFKSKYGRATVLSGAGSGKSDESILPGGKGGIMSGAGESEQRAILERKKAELEKSVEKDPDFSNIKGFVEITIAEGGLRIELVEARESVFFESARANLKPAARRLLSVVARVIKGIPNPVSIEGHTDAHPVRPGLGFTNWELSSDRALAARRALREGGLPDKQIVAVQGYADRNPRIPSDPYHFSNRRVSILVHYLGNPTKSIQQQGIEDRFKRNEDSFKLHSRRPPDSR